MTANTFTIKEIAEKNALSAKTVQNAIKANPQLGIVMRPKVKTVLTFEQAAQLSAVLGKKKSQFSENSENESDIPRVSQETENFEEGRIRNCERFKARRRALFEDHRAHGARSEGRGRRRGA